RLCVRGFVARVDISKDEAEAALADFQSKLEQVFRETREGGWTPPPQSEPVAGLERPEAQLEDAGTMVGWQTAVSPKILERIGQAHVRPPEGFTVHPKLESMLAKREQIGRASCRGRFTRT